MSTNLAEGKPPRIIDQPHEGWFKTRLVKKGPWTPARIVRKASQPDRSPTLVCLVGGEPRDALSVWPYLEPVSEAEYARLVEAIDDPTKAFDARSDIPDFGQGQGHNSRDSALAMAAKCVVGDLSLEPGTASRTDAERVAQLVKAVINERDRLAGELKAQSAPIKAQLERLRAELACDAEEYRPQLLEWLGRWMERAGTDKVQASGATAYWRDVDSVQFDVAELPREFLVPNGKAIAAALKAGRKVRGAQLVTSKKAQVA